MLQETRPHPISTVITGPVKILNTVIYFTNFDKSFGITNTLSPQIILSSFFLINVNLPSFKWFRIQHEIHPFTSTLINTSMLMQLFPVNYIIFDFIKFQSRIFFSKLLLLLLRPSACKAWWGVILKAPLCISQSSSPVTPENAAGLRRREEYNKVLPTHPDKQATWKHYNTSINIAMDIIIQYSASLARFPWQKGSVR